jgi:hypothetical protein
LDITPEVVTAAAREPVRFTPLKRAVAGIVADAATDDCITTVTVIGADTVTAASTCEAIGRLALTVGVTVTTAATELARFLFRSRFDAVAVAVTDKLQVNCLLTVTVAVPTVAETDILDSRFLFNPRVASVTSTVVATDAAAAKLAAVEFAAIAAEAIGLNANIRH